MELAGRRSRGGAGELYQLYLGEAAKGSGVADALMEWAYAKARALGGDTLYLSVFAENHRARRFYDRHGFVEVGPYEFMVGDHADDGHHHEAGALSAVEPIHAVSLGALPHGFLGRRGGVSTGIVAGLNVGSGSSDDPAAVVRNRGLAIAAI